MTVHIRLPKAEIQCNNPNNLQLNVQLQAKRIFFLPKFFILLDKTETKGYGSHFWVLRILMKHRSGSEMLRCCVSYGLLETL